jgi:hypothetical protein
MRILAPNGGCANAGRGWEWLKTISASHPSPNPIKAFLTNVPLDRGLIFAVHDIGGFFSVGNDGNANH